MMAWLGADGTISPGDPAVMVMLVLGATVGPQDETLDVAWTLADWGTLAELEGALVAVRGKMELWWRRGPARRRGVPASAVVALGAAIRIKHGVTP